MILLETRIRDEVNCPEYPTLCNVRFHFEAVPCVHAGVAERLSPPPGASPRHCAQHRQMRLTVHDGGLTRRSILKLEGSQAGLSAVSFDEDDS